jgi:hypothetical protein
MIAAARGRRRRTVALVLVVVALAVLAPFAILSAIALTSPYSSVAVPATCARTIAPVAPGDTIAIPGHGSGTLLAADGDRAVVVTVGPGPLPRPLAAYLVDRSAGRVLWVIPLQSDALVAAIDDGIAFIWDDKIGYTVSTSTGEPLGALVRSDNYRGIYETGDGRRLQLDAEVTAIGLGGALVSQRTFPLAGVVDGCAFGL